MRRRLLLVVALLLPLLTAGPQVDASPADQAAKATAPTGSTALTLRSGVGGSGDDILWYAPGPAPDYLWSSRGDGTYASSPLSIRGDYEPLAADFDGDGDTDVFWYRAGPGADYLWLSNGAGAFTSVPLSVRGTYQPLLVDLDGESGTDIFWYAPGASPDHLWRSGGDGSFTSTPMQVRGTYRPFAGDFDGDGLGDLFWYRPGPLPDYVWLGRGGGRVAELTTAVTGDYLPTPGDYDGDLDTDVLWYAPGGRDHLWSADGDGTFSSSTPAIPAASSTTVAQDHDADGDTDVLFTQTSIAPAMLLRSNGDGTFAPESVFAPDGDVAIAGDHDADGRGDVFFYSPGARPDFLWLSGGDGTFTAIAQQVSGTYRPVGGGAFIGAGGTPDPITPAVQSPAARFPALRQTTVLTGLTIPWGLDFFPDGTMIVGERSGRVTVKRPGGSVNGVTMVDDGDLRIAGETGRMGLAVDPDFATNRRFYSCQGDTSGPSVQVIAWQMNAQFTTASRVVDPLVGGLPASSGRHGGCRLRFGPDGFLYVGTGDAAIGTTPQDLTSLGGKVLRVEKTTGEGAPGNPFITSSNANTRRIFTSGHRNVQGLAVQPGSGQLWSVEHGPARDDEINALVGGANHGWDPVPGYDEAVPMTDLGKFPGASPAEYSTGVPTLAMSGADFIDGSQNPGVFWSRYAGGLAVASLKNSTLRVFFFDANDRYLEQRVIIDGTLGRLRTVEMGPDGALYVTTSNGNGNDRVVRIAPA